MHLHQFLHRYPPAIGGAESYAARLARFLAASGDEITVWTSTADDLSAMWRKGFREFPAGEESPEPGVTVRRYRPLHFPGRRYVLKAASLLPVAPWQAAMLPCNPVSLKWWRDAERYAGPIDAVHGLAFPHAGPLAAGLRLARRRGVPFVLTPFLHLGDAKTRRQYTSRPLRWLLRAADRVFVQTELEAEAARDLGVEPGRVVLQGLGVEPAEVTGGDRGAGRGLWQIGERDVVVGHLANLSREKGSLDLVDAGATLPDFALLLSGPEMPNFVEGMRSRPRVFRSGALSDEARRDFFAAIDIFALPSYCDSFGLVLLEAWANGVPVVAYRAGGPGELVRHGTDGLLAEPGDIAGLRAALLELARDDAARRRMGEAGRARTGAEFRWHDKLSRFKRTVGEL